MNLRENQVIPVQKGIDYFRSTNPKPSIIIAPTAFGKSVVIASIAKGIEDKILVIQPSKELLEQNHSKFINMGGKASIFSASLNEKRISNVTYATIGSAINYVQDFVNHGITKIIIDECDRFPRDASGMLRRFIDSTGITHCLGLTATPFKLQTNVDQNRRAYSKLMMLTSKSKMGNFFKEIIHVAQISEMVDKEFWSKLVYESYDFNTGKLVYNSSKSDFSQKSIEKEYKNQSIDDKIVNKVSELVDRKSILIAVPSIADAVNLSKRIPSCAAIHSEMKKKDRDKIITDFKSGKLRVIAQVNILAIGFDHPELDCIITGRPTASLSWWYQFVGRATRIHPDKKDALIVDFVGSVPRFGRVEDLYFRERDGIWKLYGEGGKLITGIPMHEIGLHLDGDEDKPKQKVIIQFGKHSGQEVKYLPKSYREWMLKNFEWNGKTIHIREELMRLAKMGV